jgi:CelD/BcsL family acetyltransferase involved in cellulose biosynthesis
LLVRAVDSHRASRAAAERAMRGGNATCVAAQAMNEAARWETDVVAGVRPLADVRRSTDWRAWRALAANAPPFLAPEFFSLTEPLAEGDPIVVEATRGPALVGVLPLARADHTLLALRSDHTPLFDYCGTPEGLDAIWRTLSEHAGWDELYLKVVPVESLLATRLCALAEADGCKVVTVGRSQHRVLDLPGFEEAIGAKHRANLRRCARNAGGVSLERIPAPSRADLEAAIAIEAMAWKRTAGTSIDADRRVAHFYDAAVRLFARRGSAAVSFLRANGQRIASLISFEDGRTLYALKIGYDPAFAGVSPGHLLVWLVAGDAEKRGLATLDFVGEDSEWKRRWTEKLLEHVSFIIYRPTPRGMALYTYRHVVKPRLPATMRDPHMILRHGCQKRDLIGAHSPIARVRGRVRGGLGVRSAVRRLVTRATPDATLGEASRFEPGSWVRVVDAERVRAMLDANQKLRGLAFVPTQWETCGNVYRVQKRVRRLRDDHGKSRAVSRTVILEDVTCAGTGHDPAGCGRHCPLMFRDEWLEPAAAPRRAPPAQFAGTHAHVRSLDEIRAGLDWSGRRDGLTFMPEMEQYAGQRFRVAGKLRRVFEYDRWSESRAGIYVLQGLACAGAESGTNGPCDRACALLWHEDWLVIEPPAVVR